ncbi:MAG: alpha 1,2 mannosyltransferase [Piccolia ochrophora]|nr:MAG: alpha 1,2 mannosyltransferase [Piccolia ochrophora]
MWRRTYLVLLLVRLYFAFSPSYLHPDENFQGPEVIASHIFPYTSHLTWEFTTSNPIRSVLPLWPTYGLPMLLLKWLWSGHGDGLDNHVPPSVVYWTLRLLMFALSFVLEDWAVHELVQSPKQRRIAVLLVASSYVTWTYQTHTFSNSVETLLVAWSLVLIQRIVEAKNRSSLFASGMLAFLAVFGIFNRITFPAFLFIPCLQLIPHFLRKPFSLLSFGLSALLTSASAIALDTSFYNQEPFSFSSLLQSPIITPLNSFRYNISTANLAHHGLHPYYQHFLPNLIQLLGPAYILLFLPFLSNSASSFTRSSIRPLVSALSGTLVLSLAAHQEARFLLPSIPLILSSIRLPRSHPRLFLAAWIVFNAFFGMLMGAYHQAGVVPAQTFLSTHPDATTALWWRTYSPPIWLLDGKVAQLTTRDLMGTPLDDMLAQLTAAAPCHDNTRLDPKTNLTQGTYLVAPDSSTVLDAYTQRSGQVIENGQLSFSRVFNYPKHLNLDDLDIGTDGLWATLRRVVGRRGLSVWGVTRACLADDLKT